MLNNLNLSRASFSGSIPEEILELSYLTSLDLSGNPSLQLPSHGLASISLNMKGLTELSLSQVNISSAVPATFASLTSLRKLHLDGCSLQDHFPPEIFLLPRLEYFHLRNNLDLYGHLPEFPVGRNSLRSLELSSTLFQGGLPGSIGNLLSLQYLILWKCNFSGLIPYTIGNLTELRELYLSGTNLYGSIPFSLSKLEQIEMLCLSENNLSGPIPSWIGNLTKLKWLYLGDNNLNGSVPFPLSKLEQIEELDLSENHLSGQIPSWIGNLTKLKCLYLSENNLNGSIPLSLSKLEQLAVLWLSNNNLEGQIPRSIFSLKNLEYLRLSYNNLSGTMDISMFHEQKKISALQISYNQLSVVSNKFPNFSLPNLEALDLGSCNLREFPLFLKNQDRLKLLSLSPNNILGEIPAWVLNISTKTMIYFSLSNNKLTGFEQHVAVLPWSKLEVMYLGFNNIHGSVPLPPPSISVYSISNNFMGGELSPTFCKANTLSVFDLSNNELVGTLPECLGNLGRSLQFLNLKGNKFEGKIPQIHTDECSLQWIDLSQNQLKGKLPTTLAICRDLERLDVGSNHITDTFPSWLGTLPKLKVLILKMNNFHGPMGSPSSMSDFSELCIIDLSNNSLTGALPSEYFPLWKAMSVTTEKQLTYLQVHINWELSINGGALVVTAGNYSMTTEIVSKGRDMKYKKLSSIMVFISLSNNNFVGEIPESIGDLVGLVGLDLSNNNLKGSIPPAFGKLKQLESLDLSLNMLSGEIPQQLSQLTFLEYLNVSYNNLSGTVPRGGQLDRFENSSFEGNPMLHGLPLSNRRGSASEPLASHEGQEQGSSDHTKFALGVEGFATGLAIGLGIGYIIATRNNQWFEMTYLKLRYRK